MKNTRKKGFTIVELVIVIAVIAILAAVLIPTFSNVIEKANESSALQEARNTWTAYTADHAATFSSVSGYIVVDSKYYFEITNGKFDATLKTNTPEKTGYTATKHSSTICGVTDCTESYDDLMIWVKTEP